MLVWRDTFKEKKSLGKSLFMGACKNVEIQFCWFANGFSSNLNTINWIFFPNHGEISGSNLHKNNVWLSDPAPFYVNYWKIYFDAKHLKTGWNRVVKFVAHVFQRKCSFRAILDVAVFFQIRWWMYRFEWKLNKNSGKR